MEKTKLYPYPHMKNSNKDNMKLISVLLFLVLTVLLLFNLHKKELAIKSLKNEILQIQLNEKEKEKKYIEKEMQYMEKLKNTETVIEKQKMKLKNLKNLSSFLRR